MIDINDRCISYKTWLV